MSCERTFSRARCHTQRGAVLVVGLIMLLLMTMIGITAMQVTTQQERMAGSLLDRNIAFQAAETALRAGEAAASTVTAYSTLTTPDGESLSEGVFSLDDSPAPPPSDPDSWDAAHSNATDDFKGAAIPPRYMIEYQGSAGDLQSVDLRAGQGPKGQTFKVAVRAMGGRNDTVAILQSTFIRAAP